MNSRSPAASRQVSVEMTPGLEALIKFYTRGLGLLVIKALEFDGVTEIILGYGENTTRPVLMLLQLHDEEASARVESAAAKLVLTTDDALQMAEHLRQLGYAPGAIRRDPVNAMQGFSVSDPEGNVVEVIEYPLPVPAWSEQSG